MRATAGHAAGQLQVINRPRGFADLIDDATRLAAPEQHCAGTAQHVDLFQVEGFAVVLGGIADAIQIHVTKGVEAAQVHVVARAATFGSVEGQTGHIAQCFPQRAGLLLFHQLVGDGGYGLRNVVRVLHGLADPGLAGAQAIRLFGVGADLDRAQLALFTVLRLGSGFVCRRLGGIRRRSRRGLRLVGRRASVCSVCEAQTTSHQCCTQWQQRRKITLHHVFVQKKRLAGAHSWLPEWGLKVKTETPAKPVSG